MALVFAASELGRSQDSNESPKLIRYRKIMIFLGLSEIFVGSISILLGILQVALVRPSSSSISSNTSPQSYGEGIWAGIWVVVAGVLCTAAAKTKTKLWLIQTHLGFAIAGAISAAIEITISVILSLPKDLMVVAAHVAAVPSMGIMVRSSPGKIREFDIRANSQSLYKIQRLNLNHCITWNNMGQKDRRMHT
ncbi:uncharacterized protein LOC100186486 isoform X2 [Ciona intestinalis]